MTGRVLSKVITFIFTIYLARKLQEFGFGQYSFALSFASFIGLFASIGSEIWMTRELSKKRENASVFLGNVLSLQVLLVLTTSLLIVPVILFTYLKTDFWLIFFMCIAMLFRYYSLPTRAIFAAHQKFEYETIAMVVDTFLAALLGIIAIQLGFGLVGLAFSQIIAAACVIFISLRLVRKKFIKPFVRIDLGFWKVIVKRSMPFLLLGIFSFFYLRIDIILLKFMKGDNAVGWYSAAYRIIDSLLLLAMNYGQAILPVFSESYYKNKEEMISHLRLSLSRLLIAGLLISVLITFFSSRIILLFYGKAYSNSISPLRILIWKIIPGFANYVLGNTLIAIGKENIPAITIGSGSAVNIICNIILIPRFGFVGAAITAVITEVYAFFLQFVLVLKYLNLKIFISKSTPNVP
jgi:O-antigen/teichoic acid export membrane protein